MVKELIRKLLINKRNNQFSITLPKKKINLLKNAKLPKKIKIKDWEMIF